MGVLEERRLKLLLLERFEGNTRGLRGLRGLREGRGGE